ncbi:Uncharacterised protein [Serratia liquefaciens]|nr:Uncharacterised protein [Serratia liquefaciens]CAI0950252.1 Uncharacterised protein [Serratia liquefaciens]
MQWGHQSISLRAAIDLRVEVTGGDEAEFIPWLEGEVIQEP